MWTPGLGGELCTNTRKRMEHSTWHKAHYFDKGLLNKKKNVRKSEVLCQATDISFSILKLIQYRKDEKGDDTYSPTICHSLC